MHLRKGTTLIEAVVAIALLALMTVWAVRIYYGFSSNSVKSEEIEIASVLASGKIEYLKTLQKNQIDNITTSSSVIQFPAPYGKFGYKYVVPQTMPSGDQNPIIENGEYLKYIEVDIYLMSDTSNPILRAGCNFLRKDTDGSNAGL